MREVSIDIIDWVAEDKSELLGAIEFEVIKGKKSYVTAGSTKADLPCKMVISLQSVIYLNGEKVDEQDAEVTGLISAFPPAPGDLFDISSDKFELEDIIVEGVVCRCSN